MRVCVCACVRQLASYDEQRYRQVVSILAEEELFVLARFANALQIEVFMCVCVCVRARVRVIEVPLQMSVRACVRACVYWHLLRGQKL